MTPRIIKIYQKEYEKKLQDEYDKINYVSWLNGLYIMNAIGVFIDKKNKYPNSPKELMAEEQEDESLSDCAAGVGEAKFLEYVLAYNKSLSEKGGEVSVK